jgi:hypothetical protein
MRVVGMFTVVPDAPEDIPVVRDGDVEMPVSPGDFDSIHRRRWLRCPFGVRVRLLFMGRGLLLDGLKRLV